MGSDKLNRHAFEALCILASKEGWCWKIDCPTCQHMYFRYSFMQLVKGEHPHSRDWLPSKNNLTDLYRKLGPVWGISRRCIGPTIEEQEKLIGVLSGASIIRISRQCRFPAWLGYLGLGLSYTEDAEANSYRLTKSWKPQLLQILSTHTNEIQLTKLCIFDQVDSQLRWQHLEGIEAALVLSNQMTYGRSGKSRKISFRKNT